MSKGQRFTEEFRVEAVRQVTERGFAVKEVCSFPERITKVKVMKGIVLARRRGDHLYLITKGASKRFCWLTTKP
jgi:hypothetical protein